jgi:hypothetical protein
MAGTICEEDVVRIRFYAVALADKICNIVSNDAESLALAVCSCATADSHAKSDEKGAHSEKAWKTHPGTKEWMSFALATTSGGNAAKQIRISKQ